MMSDQRCSAQRGKYQRGTLLLRKVLLQLSSRCTSPVTCHSIQGALSCLMRSHSREEGLHLANEDGIHRSIGKGQLLGSALHDRHAWDGSPKSINHCFIWLHSRHIQMRLLHKKPGPSTRNGVTHAGCLQVSCAIT